MKKEIEKMTNEERKEYFSVKLKEYKVLLESKIRELEYENLKDKDSIRVYVLKSEIKEVRKLIEDVEGFVNSLNEEKKAKR